MLMELGTPNPAITPEYVGADEISWKQAEIAHPRFFRPHEVKGVATLGEAIALFQVPGTPQCGGARDFQFDVSADGQRFLMPNTGSVAPLPLTVIENWQEKFRR